MDKSLDEIIRTGSKRGGNRQGGFQGGPPKKKKNFQQGNIKFQQIRSGPAFNVTGLGRVKGFDARQKIQVKDARDKIAAKKKVIDARQHLQKKTATQKPLDARSKIGNSKPTKVDARQLIKSRQGQHNQPQVLVTGLGNVNLPRGGLGNVNLPRGGLGNVNLPRGGQDGGILPHGGGGLQKSIQNDNFSITRTVPQNPLHKNSPQQRFHQQLGNNITIVARQDTTQQTQPRKQPLGTNQGKFNLQGSNPVIQIRNDRYEDTRPTYHEDTRPTFHQPDTRPTYHQPQRSAPQQRITSPVSQPMQTKISRVPQVPVTSPQERTRLRAPPVVAKPKPQLMEEEDDSELIEENVPSETVISPLQGFRVAVTNLHPVVTQEDVVELFGAVGALKKARLLQVGTADVVFVKRDDAINAVKKYHMRELDGQPMHVNLKTPSPANVVKQQPTVFDPASRLGPPPSRLGPEPSTYQQAQGTLRLMKPAASSSSKNPAVESNLDTGLIHKALFKTAAKEEGPARPVTFTVKI